MCTLGPSSLNPRTIKRLAELNADLFRLNLSHTRVEQLEEWVALIRAHSDVPICIDTQGAQVRTGSFSDGAVLLHPDTTVQISPPATQGSDQVVPLYPDFVVARLRVGDLIRLDFDSVVLQVISVGNTCEARVLCGGTVGSNKAASVDRVLPLPPLTESDRAAMELVRKLGIRHIALSFTNHRTDIEHLRDLVGDAVTIIAKIESRSGIENLNEILHEADAILIDRGDLSRQVPIETVPLIQKRIIHRANLAHVPVYVATNLLESMITTLQPTRAEVNDVMNTLLDGADGLVLAAETAVGRHPIGCVGMIRALIDEYERHKSGQDTVLPLLSSTSGLIVPHGGRLIDSVIAVDDDALTDLPTIDIDERVAMDVRQIALGGFSPIKGFMTRDELHCVLDTNRLPDGTVWPLPILFQLPSGVTVADLTSGPLRLVWNGEPYGLLRAPRYFSWDLRDLARRWFGTDSAEHPGVVELFRGSDHFVAGRVELLENGCVRREPFELSPSQARVAFEHRGWRRVVGFHTRNVPHRAHEYVQLNAFHEHQCDGIFVPPVTDPKKSGDWIGSVLVKAYQILIAHHYPPNSAIVSGFLTYSRYAGPREALFTALCRQNYGCSHFIVGRDHTGVGDFYPPDAARRLIEGVAADIAIEPIFCDEIYYCQRCQQHLTECRHGRQSSEPLSGTVVRQMLNQGLTLPEWFMRQPVSRYIREELRNGGAVFVP